MSGIFLNVFESVAIPHVFVLRDGSEEAWIYILSNVCTSAALLAMVLVLYQVVRRKDDHGLRGATLLAGVFFGGRAVTQLMSIYTTLHPAYRLRWEITLLVALLGVAAAVALVWHLPLLHRIPNISDLEREILERRRAEEVAREKDERFRSFVDGVEDYAIYMIGPDGVVETWNHGAEQMKGYTAEEIVGQSFARFYTPEDQALGKPAETLRMAREGGRFDCEGWRMRKDGSHFLANVVVRPIFGTDGELRGFSKVTRDLTESRELETRFQMLLDAAPDAIVTTKSDGTVDFVNAQAEKLFGYQRAELTGKPVDLLVPVRTREAQATYRDRLMADPNHPLPEAPPEIFGLRNDGSEFPLEFSVSPLDTREGRVLLFAIRDLTAKRKTEARFRSVLEAAPDALFITGQPDRIMYMNRRAEELFGFTRAELLGHRVDVLIPERLRPERAREREQFFQTRQEQKSGYGGEYICLRKDGSEFPVEASRSPLETAEGIMILTSVRDITERKKMEARFRALLEAVPDAIVIYNRSTRIEYVNRRTEEMFGCEGATLLGRTLDVLVPERTWEDRRVARERIFSLAPGESLSTEFLCCRSDALEFMVEASITPLDTAEGPVILASLRDITERKKTETQFRAMLEAAPDAIVIVNREGVIEFVNVQLERLFGYGREELIGQAGNLLEVERMREEHGKYRESLFTELRRVEVGAEAGLLAQRKDGTEFPMECTLSPFETRSGWVYLIAIRDVSERLKAEGRFRALLESAPDAMVMVNGDGTIELSNLQTEKLFRYSRAELVGQSVDILVPQALRSHDGAHRNSFLVAREQREMGVGLDLMALRKDGSEFPVEISLSPLDGPNGTSVTAAIRDVSERKAAARLLDEKIAELRHSNEQLEQFAHIASHDLQEPLRMVASYTQLLSKRYRGRLDADADEFIGYAVDGTQRMKRLIEDLLTYSRAGKGGPPMRTFPSEEALDEALCSLKASIEESEATITHGPLPTIMAVDSLLAQTFQNLVGNAIKYRGKEAPRIHISAATSEKEFTFSVADNGIGIDAKYYDRIFLIFQRLHGRGEYEGTGIGLAIVQRVLQQQGGRIWVESEPGHGSTFYFSLPVR